jgi:nuclear transport factor 2 (NTF2) superfamily protein
MNEKKYPLPPFTKETAIKKVRLAEDAWNKRDPNLIALAYSEDSEWRNRGKFINGRRDIIKFLETKWQAESHYKLIKELWAYFENFISVRFQYEWYHEGERQWYRAYGNENWRFNENGLMDKRQASINDVKINEDELIFTWEVSGPRPDDFPGLTELGL